MRSLAWLTSGLLSTLLGNIGFVGYEVAQAALPTPPSKALLHVTVLEQGVPVAKGGGLFISADGKFVTSYDLVKPALELPGFSLEFESAQGGKLDKYQIGNCNAERLCLLKLPIKPSQWLTPAPQVLKSGEKLRAIGHSEQSDFITVPVTAEAAPPGVRTFAFQAGPATPSLGSGVISSSEALLGVQIGPGLAAASVSVQALIKNYLGAEQPNAYLERHMNGKKAQAIALKRKYVDPAFAKFKLFETLSDLQGFQTLRFGGTELYMGFIPDTFGDCRETGTHEVSCTDSANGGTFTAKESTAADGYLLGLSGKAPQAPAPLPIVEELRSQGKWDHVEAGLNPRQRKLLFSDPGPLHCEDNRRVTGKFPMSSGVHCSQLVQNDGQPNAARFISYVQLGRRLFEFSAWDADGQMADYFSYVPSLYQLSVQQTGFRK